MTAAVRKLLEGASALLIDFDGPLAALMPPPANARAADAARAILTGASFADDIARTTDHLAVLRWSLEHLPTQRMLEVEAACTRAELAAAAECAESVNCSVLLEYADHVQLPVAVVSNNAAAAVEAFLERTGWLDHVRAISARSPENIEWLKPRPDLLFAAADALGVSIGSVVFVGDAVSDVVASQVAGCDVISLYKDEDRRRELEAAGATLALSLDRPIV